MILVSLFCLKKFLFLSFLFTLFENWLQLGFSIFRGQNMYWRRRSNCFLNFYSLLYYLIQKRRDVQNRRRHLDTTSTNHNGHHHASDFIYASPYELIERHQNQQNYQVLLCLIFLVKCSSNFTILHSICFRI